MRVRLRTARLQKAKEGYKRIAIYGAGHMAKSIYNELIENDFFVSFCVVSNKEEGNDIFEDIPLYDIKECAAEMRKGDLITLIAVTEQYEKEIEEVLLQYNIYNYLFITDYIKTKTFLQMETEEEYLDEIAEWYVEKHGLEVKDIEVTKQRLIEVKHKQRNKNKIVFVIGWISPRTLKIATALRKKGYEIELLFCPDIWNRKVLRNKLISIGDICTVCSTIEELMYCIICSRAEVVHLFSDIYHSNVAYILVRQKKLFGKLIFDQYDITNEMYIDTYVSKETYFYEKYCLEHVDGLCCRGYEQEYLLDKKGYKIEGKIIKFFDYCRSETVNYYTEDSLKKELTLCYAGGIATEREWPEAPYACLLEFAHICAKNKCHFHVYPPDWDEIKFNEYIELDKRSEYFHFHRPVEFDKLNFELSQYDYGVHLIKNCYLDKEIVGYNTRNKVIYGVTNHFYDYLDAGIPIIAAVPVMFADFFEKQGVLIKWTLEDYDFNLLRKQRDVLRKNVSKVREELKVDKHIGELIEFYNSI